MADRLLLSALEWLAAPTGTVQVDIVVDSPLAADFTAGYVRLREHWDREARRKLTQGRHPLAFEQVTTIADHATHQPKQAQAALLRQRHRGVEVVVP